MSKQMTRRDFVRVSTGVGGATLLEPSTGRSSRAATASKQPNILLILPDDLGYGDLSCHGNPYLRTPNIDRLAGESVEMTQYYACPLCSPARAAVMTGRYNYRTGVQHTSRGGALMDSSEVTVAKILRDNGYTTGIFGKWHLGDQYPLRPPDQGFDESLVFKGGGVGTVPDLPNSYFDTHLYHNGKPVQGKGYCSDVFTDATIAFIEASRRRPFFAYLPFNAPHAPLVVDPKYSEPFLAMGLDDSTSKLYGMVANLDENVGRLLNRLRELGQEQNTIVIFTVDNGAWGGVPRFNADMAGWKGSVLDGGIRQSFFFRWPALIQGGRKIDRIAAHIDVLPTLLEPAGARKPGEVVYDGVSLMPLLRGQTSGWPERNLFVQCHRGLTPQRYQSCAVRNQRWKAVSRPTDGEEHPAKDLPLKPAFKLFDMETDPGETTDLAHEHPEILSTMTAAYDRWYEDMQNSRHWAVGVMHIGSEKEPVTHLCVYQDSCYTMDTPTGWSVEIERGGRYRISINRAAYPTGMLMVKFNNDVSSAPLDQGENCKVIRLPAGKGKLSIWVEHEQGSMPKPSSTSWEVTSTYTIGDCDVEFVGA